MKDLKLGVDVLRVVYMTWNIIPESTLTEFSFSQACVVYEAPMLLQLVTYNQTPFTMENA
jgi:hypothetical protein